jgi:site-specific recombinase XerC
MGIVLGKLPDPEQTMQNPRPLMPVHTPQLKEPERKIFVTSDLGFINKYVPKAVHGLYTVLYTIHLGEVHKLNFENIDLENRKITVLGKGNKRRCPKKW